jgi:hypothetical protein
MVVGGTEEIYLVWALQSDGKQKIQICLDAVSSCSFGWSSGLSSHGRKFPPLPPWLGLWVKAPPWILYS